MFFNNCKWLGFMFLLLLASCDTMPKAFAYESGSLSDAITTNASWHRWTSQEFVVLSLDNEQGKALASYLPQMKKWVITRWGFPNTDLSVECRIVAVPDVETMYRLFHLRNSHTEVVIDERGAVKLYVIWLLFDRHPLECLPPSLLRICLRDYEYRHGVRFGTWAVRGMSVLSMPLPYIREGSKGLGLRMSSNNDIFHTRTLLTMNYQQWNGMSVSSKDMFDAQAAVTCLLLRKEFGQKNFLQYLVAGSTETDLKQSFGFSSYREFESTFKRYAINLANDISQNRTPDSYLTVTSVK
jgi:hypothetical protein